MLQIEPIKQYTCKMYNTGIMKETVLCYVEDLCLVSGSCLMGSSNLRHGNKWSI